MKGPKQKAKSKKQKGDISLEILIRRFSLEKGLQPNPTKILEKYFTPWCCGEHFNFVVKNHKIKIDERFRVKCLNVSFLLWYIWYISLVYLDFGPFIL